MFIRLQNAATGKFATINPMDIRRVEDRSGNAKYQNTNGFLHFTDGGFMPCVETEEYISSLLAAQGRTGSARMPRSVMPISDDDPGPVER